jgi:hypothetical protein
LGPVGKPKRSCLINQRQLHQRQTRWALIRCIVRTGIMPTNAGLAEDGNIPAATVSAET